MQFSACFVDPIKALLVLLFVSIIAQHTRSVHLFLFISLFRPELIATGVIQLIENDSNNGAVMMVTKKSGIEFMRQRKYTKSKL